MAPGQHGLCQTQESMMPFVCTVFANWPWKVKVCGDLLPSENSLLRLLQQKYTDGVTETTNDYF